MILTIVVVVAVVVLVLIRGGIVNAVVVVVVVAVVGRRIEIHTRCMSMGVSTVVHTVDPAHQHPPIPPIHITLSLLL